MITIYDWFGYNLSMKERYQLIKETGFEGVLLWWSNGFGRDCYGLNDYRKGPGIAREAGLFVDLCQYFGHKKLNIFSLHDINT